MTPEERVQYEASVRNRQVVLAGAAGILIMLAVIVQLGGPHVKVNEQTLGLVTENKRFTRDLVGSIISSVGSFALAFTLWWLWGASRARDPTVKPRFVGILAAAGGVLSGVSVIAYVVGYGIQAHHFVHTGNQTYPEAHALLGKAWLVIPQITNDLGLLLVAISLVMVSLTAMRVGLLTRFLGYLGIVAGALTIIPLVPIPIVECYWLLALAYLLSGRWPSGVPPAWADGKLHRWPSSAELRGARGQARGGGRPGRGKPAPAPAAPAPVTTPATASSRSATSKRKRKRRH
jgi:hypothetical protein